MSQNLETAIKALTDNVADVSGKLKAQAERATADGLRRDEDRARVDELLSNSGAMQQELKALKQELAELEGNGAGADLQHVSPGRQFVESANFKALAAQPTPRGRADFTLNAAITTIDTGNGNGGALIQKTRLPGILELPRRRLTIRDLLLGGRMDGNTLEYVRETGFTNNAGMVAETARKPESSIEFDLQVTTAKVIAHYMKASRQVLSDASQLASIIDGRLRYGLDYREEEQILRGDGTGQNLLGLIPQASAYAATPGILEDGETATVVDTIRLALLQAELAEFPADGIIISPQAWAKIELAKDTLGRYILGNPQGVLTASLWNTPVVTSRAMDAEEFLVGGFGNGAQIFDRWDSRIEVATENEDDFVKNMVTILGEKRLAFAVYRPEAFVTGQFDFGVGAGG